jgi:hypothetical protein
MAKVVEDDLGCPQSVELLEAAWCGVPGIGCGIDEGLGDGAIKGSGFPKEHV